jgi:hypothetical protein
MRTEVRIRFDGNDVPGGAQAILGPARCGPDVASAEKVDVLRQVVVWVTLDADDDRLRILLKLLVQHGVDPWEHRRDLYTDEELDGARLLIIDPLGEFTVFGGPRVGTSYDMSDACPKCGAGARQTSALIIDGEDVPGLEGRRAASTHYSDIIVDERLAEELENIGATGLSFRSVYALMENKRQVKLRWRQVCARRTLPPRSPRSTGIMPYRPCPSCTRSGVSTSVKAPIRLAYRAQDLAQAEDVNTTWEWFSDSHFDGDVSDALFPYPWLLVTPKVMRIFRAAGVTEFDWIPIRVIEGE